MSTRLPLKAIRTDGGTQPRAIMDFPTVEDYMDAMAEGTKFPPIVVFYDGTNYWLADGFHRVEASFGAGREDIECDVHQGTREDAQWYSFGANKTNGLRRSNEDKQRAVKAALAHPTAATMSDRHIAAHVGVSHEYVRQMRPPLSTVDSPKRAGLDGRTINVANIGKRAAPPPPVPTMRGREVPWTPPPTAAPPMQTKASAAVDPAVELARFDCARLLNACAQVAGCRTPAKEVAALIRRAENRTEIVRQLEAIREYIAEAIREAAL